MLEAAPVYPKFERTQSKEPHLLVVDPADIHFDTGQIYFLLFRYCLICIKVFPLLEMSVFIYGLLRVLSIRSIITIYKNVFKACFHYLTSFEYLGRLLSGKQEFYEWVKK